MPLLDRSFRLKLVAYLIKLGSYELLLGAMAQAHLGHLDSVVAHHRQLAHLIYFYERCLILRHLF